MPNLIEYKNEKRLKYLLCGDPGTGKSILAASASKWGPVYIFDLDGRFESVYEFYKDRPEGKNISYDTYCVETGKESQVAKEIANKLTSFKEHFKKTGKPPFSTIIFDSWTNWEAIMLSRIIADTPTVMRKHVEFGNMVFAAPDQRNDYLLHAQGQKMFIKQLMGVTHPMNVIVVAHTKDNEDKFGRKTLRIAAAGKLDTQIAVDFNEVHLLKLEKLERVLSVIDDSFPTKTSIKSIGEKGNVKADLSVFDNRVYKQ